MSRGSDFCFFLPSLSGGGAEKTIVFLANSIADQGYSVDLVLADSTGPWQKQVSSSVRVIDLQASRIIRAVIPLARYLHAAAPRAVLSALTHANLCLLTSVSLARYEGRVLVSERNSLLHVRAAKGLKSALKMALIERMYQRSDAVICVSEALSEEIRSILRGRATVVKTIYNPVDFDRIAKISECAPSFALAGPRKLTVVAMGRLSAQKDFSTLIKAFSQGERTRTAHLYILGEGPDRQSLEALAKDLKISERVHMPGFVENAYAFLARASVFVLSSRYEGMPNALLEAMACGCRVVSTRCPTGPEEILRAYPEIGELVPVGDVATMAKAIDAALDCSCVPNAKAALRRFDPLKVVASYLSELEESSSRQSRKGNA